jgi:phenylacetate-coenzyme A ligase PaaK-like adenylate-forming protein
MRVWAGLHGTRLPVPMHVPLAEPSGIMRWISGLRGRGGGIFTTPSSALRLALTAARTGADLAGLVFITIGEPLTPVKRAGIQAVGARAFSSLGFTEFGRATYGCSVPASPDDTHIVEDAVAVIQRRRAVDRMGTEVDALLFTALRPDARKILLNMETGDYAAMNARRCGCPLEAVGWTRHLEGIRSFEKLNAEGRLFFGSELITLVEDVLPRRFGGDATDYQLIEQEDREGFTRLSVLVHPRLAVDEHALLACVEDTFRSADRSSAQTWQDAGTIQVRRAVPIMTGAGKVMALHHLRPGEHPTG